MVNLTPEKINAILDGLKTKFESVENISNVIVIDEEFSSKRDGIDAFTVKDSDNERAVKYCYITFEKFEDSKTDGCDDMPVVFLYFNAHLVFGYKEKRKNGTTPKKDHLAQAINLRNKFLEPNRSIQAVTNTETEPLRQKSNILLDDDPLTGVYAYFVDLEIKVTVW